MRVRCSGACQLTAQLLLPAAHHTLRVIGSARMRLTHAGMAPVRIRLASTAARELKRMRPSKLTLTMSATGAKGAHGTLVRLLTL
jgi:hypothetical protein